MQGFGGPNIEFRKPVDGTAQPKPNQKDSITPLYNYDSNPLIIPKGPKTYIVECRVSILGITIMIWEGIPHNSTLDPLGIDTL